MGDPPNRFLTTTWHAQEIVKKEFGNKTFLVTRGFGNEIPGLAITGPENKKCSLD
jgi:hypothetical protein